MKLIARTFAILAAALAVVGVAFALNHSSSATANAQREMPPEFAQAATTSTSGSSTAQPAHDPGGEHNQSASLFGLAEVAKNLVIVGVITAVVAGAKRLFQRRNPRSGGPRPHAPPA